MLEVRNLMVFYENALAVNDLSLEVRQGEVVGVFGSNSAGKTTLLNTIAGLTLHLQQRERRRGGMRMTLGGSLRLEGQEISQLSPRARVERGIVLCRERHPVFRDNTVEENEKLEAMVEALAEDLGYANDKALRFDILNFILWGKEF